MSNITYPTREWLQKFNQPSRDDSAVQSVLDEAEAIMAEQVWEHDTIGQAVEYVWRNRAALIGDSRTVDEYVTLAQLMEFAVNARTEGPVDRPRKFVPSRVVAFDGAGVPF